MITDALKYDDKTVDECHLNKTASLQKHLIYLALTIENSPKAEYTAALYKTKTKRKSEIVPRYVASLYCIYLQSIKMTRFVKLVTAM